MPLHRHVNANFKNRLFFSPVLPKVYCIFKHVDKPIVHYTVTTATSTKLCDAESYQIHGFVVDILHY